MKQVIPLLMILGMASKTWAVLPVTDAGAIAQSAGHQIVNVVHFAQTELNTLNTQVNTLKSYENSLVQLARMGDPSALRNLPVVREVGQLLGTYQQLSYSYQNLKGLANPAGYQQNFNSILNQYGTQSWQGFVAANGQQVAPSQGSFQFPVSDFNTVEATQKTLQQLEQQKIVLTQKRDQILSSMQSATDQSSVQKYSSALAAANAAIADVNAAETQAVQRSTMQQQQNQSAQRIYQAAQAEQRQAQNYQTIDQEFNALPMGTFRKPVYWNQTP